MALRSTCEGNKSDKDQRGERSGRCRKVEVGEVSRGLALVVVNDKWAQLLLEFRWILAFFCMALLLRLGFCVAG